MSHRKKYSKKNPIEHILLRPDMYVGSSKLRQLEEYVANKDDSGQYYISKQLISSSPAILRIFVEALSNAIDNVERSKKTDTLCTYIKINIDKDSGETSISNDGDIVPIEKNEEENCYNHTMIFGQLLTGSNYDDEEERIISGRNGLGIKLCNVFSSYFSVEGCDPVTQQIFFQSWTNNMRQTTGPVIKKTKLTKGYTKVTWIPDFTQFGIDKYTDDIINLYTRYILDAAMLSKVKIYLNKELLPYNNLQKYSTLYQNISDEKLYIKTNNSEVLLSPYSEFQAISFVNGVYTKLGGQHVNSWIESIFRPLLSKINKKGKPLLNIKDIKQFFRIFVVATVINPEFDGQNKFKLEAPEIKTKISKNNIDSILKWNVINDIEDIIRSKEMMVMKKSERKKKGFTKINGLDPANNAGTKNSYKCTLVLCEGLSAKSYVVAGIEKGVYDKKGRDWFGIYPLRGKLLNVRNAVPTAISKNAVITDIIQTLGLRHDIDYRIEENYKTLRYGKVMVTTDADVDGIHIEGLLMNLFHSLFPTILLRQTPYIVSMKTPIVRVFGKKGEKDLLFYDERKYHNFVSQTDKKFKAKYYKGLGTTKPSDVPDTFGLKMVEYKHDDDTNFNMNKVFDKRFADSRKNWLEEYNETCVNSESLDDMGNIVHMNITDFINNELIKFSHNDCKRSIPNCIDGLKESQRKILYSVKKRNLKYNGTSLKVAQLGGYVAEHTNYQHGEQNLFETITKMANEFPGSNNIPLLYRDGMFGTRLAGGKDAASPRYIFTKMEALTHLIFRQEDDVLLDYIIDDGDLVEPKFYIPIIPMILVNGCSAGIGTGWSSNIPCYNPLELIECIKIWLDTDGEIFVEDPDNEDNIISLFPELNPWYRDFTGNIEQVDSQKYITTGQIQETKKENTIQVTELPIGLWTDKFKEICEDLLESKKIKSIKNYSTTKKVNFFINETQNGIKCNINTLKLKSYIYTSNLVLFNTENKIKKYKNVYEIIQDFCTIRFSYYVKRKEYLINSLKSELLILQNKHRFINEIVNNNLNIMNIPEEELILELENKNYNKINDNYDYLLKLQIRTFTQNKIIQLTNEIQILENKINILLTTTEKQMWLSDIEDFVIEYKKWIKKIQ